MDAFRNYDSWLEKPYQDRYAEAERLLCPKCEEAQMEEDSFDGSAECPACGHVRHGVDWDDIAESRAEAREMDDPGRDVW